MNHSGCRKAFCIKNIANKNMSGVRYYLAPISLQDVINL